MKARCLEQFSSNISPSPRERGYGRRKVGCDRPLRGRRRPRAEEDLPALQAMVRSGELDEPVIGVARSERRLEQWTALVRDSLEKQVGVDVQAFASLSDCSGTSEATTMTRRPSSVAQRARCRRTASVLSGHPPQPVRHRRRRAGKVGLRRRAPAWSSKSLSAETSRRRRRSTAHSTPISPSRPFSASTITWKGIGPEPDLLPLRQSAD